MGCSVALGVRQSSGIVWDSRGGTGSLWPFSVIITPCPSSAGFSHTMEQSAQASPVPIARGPTKGFCTPLLLIPKTRAKALAWCYPEAPGCE